MNQVALGIFLGSVFLCFLLSYWIFNLSKEKRERIDGEERLVTESTQNKFLQMVLISFVLISLVLNAYSVMDMSGRVCDWNVINSTTVGATTSYVTEYECTVIENNAGRSYFRLINYGGMFLAAMIIIYVIGRLYKAAQEARGKYRRDQGR